MMRTRTLLILALSFTISTVALDGVAAEGITLRIMTFPPDAVVTSAANGVRLVPARRSGAWREFDRLAAGARLDIRAPGYQPLALHLPDGAADVVGGDGVVEVQERLLPIEGPLHLVAELPTGPSPKSVAFLPGDRLVVPLLRGDGADVYRLRRDRWGQTQVEERGTIAPPAEFASASGFVAPLVLPARDELWISQMNNDMVHRFRLSDLAYRDSRPSGGRWPKVMEYVGPESGVSAAPSLVVADWESRAVAYHRLQPAGAPPAPPALTHLSGDPRGLALVERPQEPPELWVCEFSTGDLTVLDAATGREIAHLDLGPGAARHIVAAPDGGVVYYSDMYHGTVSVVDTARREVLRRRRIGINLNTIVLDPAGRYLFVSERGRNNPESYLIPGPEFGRLHVLEAGTLAPVQTIRGRNQPTGLAVSPDGTLLAATDFLDDNLAVYRISDRASSRN